MKLLGAMMLALVPLAAQAAGVQPGATGLEITYDMTDLPLVIQVDGAGTVALDEMPFPGRVIYQPSTSTVYYLHSDEDEWIQVPPTATTALMAQATATAEKTAGQPWQGQPTQLWEVKAGGNTCDQWQGSASAAQQTGLNVADLTRIFFTVQWLNSGTVENACDKLAVSAETARKVGLPVLFTGPNGRWQLQKVEKVPVAPIELPKAAPLTAETRLRLLLVQYPPEERAALLKKYGHLPVDKQVEAIGAALGQESLP